MAQRYSGRYSPGQPPELPPAPGGPAPQPPRRRGPPALMLAFAGLAFLLPAFRGSPRQMVLSVVACGLVVLAAWLVQEGQRAAEAYEARRVARRPAIPRKGFAAALLAAALFAGGLLPDHGLLYPALYALLGAGLMVLTFGLDPMRDKGMEGVDSFQTDRVARAVDEGEAYLAGMKDAILRANDRSLETRVDRFAAAARQLFRTIEGDPAT